MFVNVRTRTGFNGKTFFTLTESVDTDVGVFSLSYIGFILHNKPTTICSMIIIMLFNQGAHITKGVIQ